MKNPVLTATRRIDPGLALALFLAVAAAWPFLARPSLPRETDAELHVFRTAELGYSLRALDFYPRWAPDFYYGYGYPIFNYYAPLTYYLANLLSLAIPNGAVFGVKAVFVLGFMLAGSGAYSLARLYTGSRGGLIAAASFLFAPYVYLIDSHLRGDLAELFALVLAPAAFWAVGRNHSLRSRRTLGLATVLPAALILSHNLLSLVFFAMLVAYAVWNWLGDSRDRAVRQLGLELLPLVLAVGLSAFFWLPVALENSEVQLHNLIGPGHFDYKEHFLTLTELFAPSLALDLGSVNPAFRLNLGVGQWILGALGLAGLVLALRNGTTTSEANPPQRLNPRVGLFWPTTLGILVFLMVDSSAALWESIPLMAFFQFPWRMLGPAGLALAVTGGFAERLIELTPIRPQIRRIFVLAAAGLPILAAAPIFAPPAWGDFGPTDLNAMLDFELNGLALGTTSTGDFVPSAVDVVPPPDADVIASYRAGGPVDRVNRHTLPGGSSVALLEQRPTAETYRIRTNQSFVLRLYRFMFAGWKASIDGAPVEIEVAKPEGFMTIHIPQGEHLVRVWLGPTPPRAAASALSAASLLILIVLVRLSPLHGRSRAPQPLECTRDLWLGLPGVFAVVALGAAIGLWQPRSTGTHAAPAEHAALHYLEGGIDLIGYDVSTEQAVPGESIPLTLYWKAREPIPANYQVFVHLTTVPQHTWAQSDKLNPGDYPTTRWPLDRYVRDPHSLTIPPGTPPGTYTIRVGLWNHGTGRRQLVLKEDGTILGDSVALPVQVTVSSPAAPPDVGTLPIEAFSAEEVAPGVTLLGAAMQPGTVFDLPMGQLTVELYWRADAAHLPDYFVAVQLVADNGLPTGNLREPITDGNYPPSAWLTGDIVRDVHSLWIDSTVPAGEYTLQVGLLEPSERDVERWHDLGQVERILP